MAARETQALQIALIIFVVLTIALSVSTFMFFSKYDEERNKIAEKEKAAEAALTRAVDAETEVKNLKGVIGVAAGESFANIDTAKKKDFEELNPGMPEDKQNYRDLARQLHKTLVEAQANIIAGQMREQALADKIKTEEVTKVGEIKEYKTTVDTRSSDYQDERGKLTDSVTTVNATKDDVQKKLDVIRKEFDELSRKQKIEIEDRDAKIVTLSSTIDKLLDEARQKELDMEVADGLVRWVNQRERLIWLDRGSADGLRQQVTFKVVGAEEPNPATAPSKGSVEVTRVTDSHMAEARIVEDNSANPILPGDLLFSTVWQPGRVERFALAGFMDIDDNADSDRDLIRNLVLQSGGTIDAELLDDGTLTGEMSVGTKYLIMGDTPSDKAMTPEMQKSWTRLQRQASDMGVKKLPLNQFLDYIGYEPTQRTVALDKDARAEDFKARMPDVPRKSIGKTIDYTPIRPKPKQKTF
jgi:hypothetical protein